MEKGVSVIRRPPFGMRLGSVRCPPGIWWTPDDDDARGIERKWGWRRRRGRGCEAAVAERGGTAADRGRGSGAGRFGCGRGSGERRQRELGLQMDSSIAGRLARSALRRGQARVDAIVAEGPRKRDLRSRSSHRARSGGGKAGAGRASDRNSYTASNATLSKFIAGDIIRLWQTRQAASLTTADFDQLHAAVEDWFAKQTQVRQHVVPCTLFPHRIGSFAIGPVIFHYLHDFPTESFGISRDEFWPKPPPAWKQWVRTVWAALCGKPIVVAKAGGFHFEQIIELAVQRHAPWLALVDVSGRAPAESISTADLATDIALAAVQLICPGDDMRGLARATGRAAPVWRADLSRVPGDGLSSGTRNLVPRFGASARPNYPAPRQYEAASRVDGQAASRLPGGSQPSAESR